MNHTKRRCNHPRPYHHGDLHRTLARAAENLLEERGASGVSLREVCQCAGVSHAAPYRHFRDKAALMEAVAQAGFEQLAQMIREARESHPGDPVSQLRDAGIAYVMWATDNPERTRLMFGGMMKSDDIDETLHETAEAAYAEIYQIIDEGRQSCVFAGPSTEAVVLSCWASVHGLTMLILGTRKLSPQTKEEIRSLAALVCDTILAGIAARKRESQLP